MEIVDFVRLRRRRLLVLAMIPLLAAGAAGLVALGTSEQYAATVSVDVLAPDSDAPNTALQSATRLARLVDADEVVDATATDIDRPAGDVRRGLRASVDGTTVRIRFSTTEPGEEAALGASTGATAAIDALYDPFVTEAERRLQAADAADLAARQALSDFETGTGLAPDPASYRAVLDPQQVVDYERLQAAVARSNGQYDAAQRELDELGTRLNTVKAQVPGGTSTVELISLTTLIGRRVLTAAAIGVVVAALVLVVLELLGPSVRPTTSSSLEPVPDDVAAAMQRAWGDLGEVGVGSARSAGERR